MNGAGRPIDMEIYDFIDKKEFETLIKTQSGPYISVFMPMVEKGKETRQNPIRFKNAIERAKTLLAEAYPREVLRDMIDLDPAAALINNNEFWRNQQTGLALFISPEMIKAYRLPLDFEEWVISSPNRFHVTPLLPLIAYNASFYVLALSQNSCRLFHCDRLQYREVKPKNFPQSLEESLKFDEQEKQFQFHTGAQATGGPGKRAAMFHGHGVADDEDKDRILRYFQIVNQAVTDFSGTQSDPLILAGVEYLHAIYQEANTYQSLLDEGITGNPDHLSGQELHADAWKIMEPRTRADLDQAIAKYHDLKGTGKTDVDLLRIIQESLTGRIDQLIIPLDIHQWGKFYPDSGEAEVHLEKQPKDEDLINAAAFQALSMGAEVFPVTAAQMPDAETIIAVFRY